MAEAITIDKKRLERIKTLKASSHDSFRQGACILEAASYIAREPWSDHPECVCPVIGAFLRSWNDDLPDDERTALLLPLLPKIVGTRNPALAERRSLMAADWLVRTHTPAWLDLAGLTAQAESLRSLPEITSMAQVPSIRGPIEAVRKDTAAAWAAAWDAAWAAAVDAAWDAAGAAAWGAAGAKLEPTRKALQASALELVERMIAAEA